MARRSASKSKSSGEVRVKLLANGLPEGTVESIVRVSDERAAELIAAQQARRATLEDFSF